jgi:hypothetical protein
MTLLSTTTPPKCKKKKKMEDDYRDMQLLRSPMRRSCLALTTGLTHQSQLNIRHLQTVNVKPEARVEKIPFCKVERALATLYLARYFVFFCTKAQ